MPQRNRPTTFKAYDRRRLQVWSNLSFFFLQAYDLADEFTLDEMSDRLYALDSVPSRYGPASIRRYLDRYWARVTARKTD